MIKKSYKTFSKLFIYFYFIIIFSNFELIAQSSIKIDTFRINNQKIPKTIYGVFIDFLNDFINGSNGLWAQELYNRGFDLISRNNSNLAYSWDVYGDLYADGILGLLKGGYNENGKFYQKITTYNSNSLLGISQNVYVYDTVGGDFYIYLKGDLKNAKIEIALIDTLSNEFYFSHQIDNIDTNWKKYEVKTPKISSSHIVKLAILLRGEGNIDIDEASFMPSHNVAGVRKEYFDIFARWKPGIIRYPGGTFADTYLNIWQNSITPIDKRVAPLEMNKYNDQRMDFGLTEYLNFCKLIEAEPHILVNMIYGTPEGTKDLAEYCNADTNAKYGKLRSENGFKEPFNVKYWEIGNEEWDDAVETGNKHIPFYDALKSIDTNYMIMVCGNTWGGEKFFDDIYTTIGEKADFYSYHDITPGKPRINNYDESQRYYSVMGASKIHDNTFQYIKWWANKYNFADKIKLALTEYLIIYDVKAPQWIDTSYKNASFETGIWMASVYNTFIKNSDFQPIFEKTFGLGHIRVGFNDKGERIYYPSPIHTIMEFFRHHTGDYVVPVEIDCPTYSTEIIDGLYQSSDVPMLDVCVTTDMKTIFISVVNKHISDSLEAEFEFPYTISGINSKLYELYEDDYKVFNSPNKPELIKIREKDYIFENRYKFPPHSFTLFEVPFDLDVYIRYDSLDNKNVFIFPNPATKEIQVLIPEYLSEPSEIQIFDILANKIYDKKINDKSIFHKINLNNFANGTYILIFKNKNMIMSEQFIKF